MSACRNLSPPENSGRNARGERRFRTFKSGLVVINNKNSTISCTIRNLSDRGARLRIEGMFQPPADFILKAPTDKWNADCQVVWRKDGELGVKFSACRPPQGAVAGGPVPGY